VGLYSTYYTIYYSILYTIGLSYSYEFLKLKYRITQSIYQCESKKSPLRGPDISHFFHKRLRIFNRFFTHLLYVPIYARLQIFIQLSLTLTKLYHIKRNYPVHIICAKCPKRAKTCAFRRLRKSLIALLIVVCGK